MSELQNEQFQKRQVAYKVTVSSILDEPFAKDETSAGYIKISNLNVSRVNVMGILIEKNDSQNASFGAIDDGSGRINLRTFEPSNVFSRVNVGDSVLVVGKIREYDSEKYIIPEIVRKIENEWINLRRKELDFIPKQIETPRQELAKEPSPTVVEVIAENVQNPREKVYGLIKNLDKGDGSLIDDVIKESGNDNAEIIVKKLLESGDIFEVKPGKLKVLE